MRHIILKTINNQIIPLKNVVMKLDICNHIAQFTLIQSYQNIIEEPIEIFYTFPTPSYASVFDFSAKINDKLIKAVLKNKDEATENYNKSISEGNGTVFMEKISNDIFSVSLGNINPNANMEIIIKYVVELQTEINADQLRLNIPLTIMPRYASVFNNINDANNTIQIQQNKLVNPAKIKNKPYDLTINGIINMSDGIIGINSKTSGIKFSNMKETSVSFDIDNLENLGEDIIITIKRNMPKSLCLTQKADDLQLSNEIFRYATMVNIIPKFDDVLVVNPRDIHYTLLLDKSGSMFGNDLENCNQGAKIFLLSLPVESTFDIYQFDDKFIKFKSKNDSDKIQEAINWIDEIKSGGGTELKMVLDDVYNSIKQIGKRSVIILLSDGGISDVNDVLKLAKKNKEVNIFTIGIGQSVSHGLMQELANVSRGKAEFVNSGTDQVKDKIISQLKKSQRDLPKDQKNNKIQINVDGCYKMVPETIPTLYENDINTFFVLSENPIKSIMYTQIFDDYVLNSNIPINSINNNDYPLHRMAGIKIIDDLMIDQKKNEIINTSLNLGILSNYTSFIGVEVREELDKTTQQCKLVEIPLQVAKKYSNDSGSLSHYVQSGGNKYTYGALLSPIPKIDFSIYGNDEIMKRSCLNTQTLIATIDDIYDNSPMRNGIIDMRLGITEYQQQSQTCYDTDNSIKHHSDEENYELELNQFVKPYKHNLNSYRVLPKTVDELRTYCNPKISFLTASNTLPTPQRKIYNPSATLNCLSDCIRHGNLLTALSTGLLTNISVLNQGEYVFIEDEEYCGIYKVWNLGSETEKWVLEKVG